MRMALSLPCCDHKVFSHSARLCDIGRQAGFLLISIINLNLSEKAEVKVAGKREEGGGGGLKGNCTPAAPLWCHSSVNRR